MARRPPVNRDKKPRRSHKIQPVCKAILLAEKIIRDENSRAFTLISLFSQFTIPGFPFTLTPFYLYAKLCDGIKGTYSMEIEVQDLQNHIVVAKWSGMTVKFSYRPETVDVIVLVQPIALILPSSVYAVVLFVDGQAVGDQKFTIKVN